ncbi:MAG: sn-glycerol-3-phosphate ABC transporter ATP-binding protein UgpC [Acholeplasmataceae bacterium]|nr:sn-glycerol-3-phosphate ABC transporter ATP-binding protein UgpC [Acholeplasmataceae bacterium]
MATLSFRNLNKVYDNGVQAVFDFSLEVKDKEFIVFVGPSGCGKSTTLRMVAGLEEITQGELYIDDVLVNDVAPKDRNIAMVFQSYALYPHMTVYDNMAFGLKLRKMPKDQIEARVKNAAYILGLQDYLKRKPKALSGGQRQRVALGRAIVRDAKVFLMDEPLSNLDAKLRVAMRAELIKLHERLEVTTIYVTHDQIEAMTMATRIVVMKDGRIQQIGTPKEIYDNPNNMFVGGFIGTPAMNFLKGEVKKDGFFYVEALKLKVPEEKFELIKTKNLIETPIILSIRPEDLHDDSASLTKYADSKASLTVDVAELLGAETNIHISIGDASIIAKVDARSDLHIGDKLELAFNMDKCHFFDPKTEVRITKEFTKGAS